MKKLEKITKSIILICIALAISIMTNKTYAAELAVSANGNNVTISSEYTGKVNITVSGGTASQSSVWLENSSETISISGVSSSGATVTVTPATMSDSDGNEKKVSAKSVKIAGSSNTNKNDNEKNKTDEKKEKEPTFKSVNDTMYSTGNINVRKSYSADSDKLGTLSTGEKVTRTGVGDNGWSKVSYNGSTGYVKTSLLTKDEPKKSEDKSLKSLSIEGAELEPEFDPEITDYTVTIGDDVKTLKVTAATNDEKASYEVTGNDKLEGTDNIIKVTVKAEDGTTRIYSITASKKAKTSGGLKSLKVNGYTLSPNFSPEVKEYKITVLDANVNNIDVTAVTGVEKAKVETTGNTNLKNGENVLTVKVIGEDGAVVDTYKITVTKNANASTAVGNTNDKKSNLVLYAGIGIIAILVIAIIVVIIKAKRSEDYDEEDEEYEDDEENSDMRGNNDNSDLYGSFSEDKELKEDTFANKYADDNSSIYGDFSAKANNQRAEEEEKVKYEDGFTNNAYNSKDIYESSNEYTGAKDVDYYSNKVSELFDRVDSQVDKTSGDAFGYLPNDDSGPDSSSDSYPVPSDNDWNDDDYRPRRSKGKHAK